MSENSPCYPLPPFSIIVEQVAVVCFHVFVGDMLELILSAYISARSIIFCWRYLPIVLSSVFCTSLICRVFVIYDVSCLLDACLPQAVAHDGCCLVSGGVDLICALLAIF